MQFDQVVTTVSEAIEAATLKCETTVDVSILYTHRPAEFPDSYRLKLENDGFKVRVYIKCFRISSNCDYGCICPSSMPTNIILDWDDPIPGTLAYRIKHRSLVNKLILLAEQSQTLTAMIHECTAKIRKMEQSVDSPTS